jgi:hypothetical protein
MISKSSVRIITAVIFVATECFAHEPQPFDASKLRAGLILVATMVTTIESRTTVVGDPVEAKVVKPVKDGKSIAVPKGARLFGRVVRLETKSDPSHRVVLAILFDHVEFDGRSIPISLASAGPLDASMDAATSRCDGCNGSDLAAQMQGLRAARQSVIETAEAYSRKPLDSPAAQPSRHVAFLSRPGNYLRLDSHTKCDWETGWDWLTPGD